MAVIEDGGTIEEGTMTWLAETMTGIDMTTPETLTIVLRQ
jgi:hypothetical protein